MDWAKHRRSLETAISLNPFAADYHLSLGRLYEWRARRQVFDPEQAIHLRKRALEVHYKALRLRPTWGEAWASLALIKAYHNAADHDAVLALDNALRYAPWEIRVLQDTAIAGMLLWPQLSDIYRKRFKAAVDRAFQLDKGRFIIDAALRYGWTAELDGYLGMNDGLRQYLHVRLRDYKRSSPKP